ncbi:MAG: ABC transporter ATP-binding protein, partial [Deltaproteobacteria bacterium]|nr:ABC transporter ATP-binding protein [Deltaproteobacteria bacterium]
GGAGKTTTIKMLTGLIKPTSGALSLFGRTAGDFTVRSKLGYLPEQPYFYDYLKADELLDIFGMICGVPEDVRKKRITALLDRVGLGDTSGKTLRKFSKGMVQRAGIAQALINDPELVILDEPLSGLDPVGRKEIRDLIASLRDEGKTVFFSSHILSDIEMICDRVAIIDRGLIRCAGTLDELLNPEKVLYEIIATTVDDGILKKFVLEGSEVERFGDAVKVKTPEEKSGAIIKEILNAGGHVRSATTRRESLEDLLIREALKERKNG